MVSATCCRHPPCRRRGILNALLCGRPAGCSSSGRILWSRLGGRSIELHRMSVQGCKSSRLIFPRRPLRGTGTPPARRPGSAVPHASARYSLQQDQHSVPHFQLLTMPAPPGRTVVQCARVRTAILTSLTGPPPTSTAALPSHLIVIDNDYQLRHGMVDWRHQGQLHMIPTDTQAEPHRVGRSACRAQRSDPRR